MSVRVKRSPHKKGKAAKLPPKPAEKRSRGRPRFVPTQEHRDLVKAMAGYKIPEDEICLLVRHPKTDERIGVVTLRKYFREELDTGFASGKMRVMAATFRNAIGEQKQNPDGSITVVREGNVTAQIWLGKTLYGMREMVQVDVPPPPPDAEHNLLDAARRVAFTLAMGASIAEKQPTPKAKKTEPA